MGEEEEGKGSGVEEMQTSQVGKKAWQCENGVCGMCTKAGFVDGTHMGL